MSAPTRRVILLGASNVALSFATIVETVRRTWDEPVEIMAAMGLGRSYGQDSWVLGRKISGIFPCALWQDLHSRPPLATWALVTDMGNDLLYGAPPETLLHWVGGCLDRLADAKATAVITHLPISSLARLGETRFQFFRKLFFPRSELTLNAARDAAAKLNDGMSALADARKMSVIPVSDAWYGFDPIHLRRRARASAWQTILSAWRDDIAAPTARSARVWQSAYLACLAPHERTILGVRRRAEQPSGRFSDGTTISLY
jgi:hypothetical protein